MKTRMTRCGWARTELSIAYHDTEWGVPVHDDRLLFEFLLLEGAQAGLSWETILRKRERYREVFDGFDAARIARYDQRKLRALLADPGIVRNRLKVQAAVSNARALLKLRETRSFADFLWSFVDGAPIVNHRRTLGEVPARTDVSDRMSKELKRRGFTFVGSTICYAFMQAVGMVNDHLITCPRHGAVGRVPGPTVNRLRGRAVGGSDKHPSA